MGQLIVFKIGEGSFQQGFPVTLQMGEEGKTPDVELNRNFPPSPNLPEIYQQWATTYRGLGGMQTRIRIPNSQITNISVQENLETCRNWAEKLRSQFNFWLRQPSCLDLREQVLEYLKRDEPVRIILQTQDWYLQRLPWHLWDLFQRYPKAEFALSTPDYQKKTVKSLQGNLKVLAVLGGSEGIEVETDRRLLENLDGIELSVLEKPALQHLNDALWKPWDIVCFSGHSSSGKKGTIQINHQESISLDTLKYALTRAIDQGLQLVIFNSCDGLGLAQDLAALHLPQVIVMREPVPDIVAQEFLKYFLDSFSQGQSFYASVRQARERLQGLENRFPCATWLPMICQNPAYPPLTWVRIPQGKIANPTLSPEAYRNRQILLNKVKNYWIKGVLETGLHGKTLIELGLEERFDAIEKPWGLIWERSDTPRQALPKGIRVTDKFDELGEGRSLLILGEPGSGKTTTLLELAKDLIARAELNPYLPIPVVFNLSSWTRKSQSISDWLIQELYVKYQVDKELGKQFISQQSLLLLLDGLDEVSANLRQDCTIAINQFLLTCGQTELVVCSRVKDYEILSTRLKLTAAIYIQPLTISQIQSYLSQFGSELSSLNENLLGDGTLQELAKSPLMLSIMALAYQGIVIENLPTRTLEERHTHLFNAYIERMFNRRGLMLPYPKPQTKRWLILLAKWMVKESQTIFLIERMQPRWLQKKWQQWSYAFAITLLGGLTAGLGIGISVGFVSGNQVGLITGLILGLGGGLGGGLVLVLVIPDIEPVETLKFSWKKAKQNFIPGLRIGILAGIIYTIAVNIIFKIIYNQYLTLAENISFCFSGLDLGLMFILLQSLQGGSIETSTIPNQGMWKSLKNSLFFAGLGMITLGILAQLIGNPILFGVIVGFVVGLFSPASVACLQHFTLRVILYLNHYIPWNYARFLDSAVSLIFLQKVGGGYIFIHRLLLEHFAKLPLD